MNTFKNPKGRSLKFKLFILSIGITFLLGVASIGILKYIIKTQESAQLNSFEAYSRNLGDSISSQFYERYGDVQAFAVNPDLKSSNRQTIIDALNIYSAMYGIYDLILVIDAKGRLVAVNNKSPDGKDIQVQDLYNKNYFDAPWFKAVINGQFTDDKDKGFNGTFVENVQIDPLTTQVFGSNRLGSSFSAPVKDAKGNVIGVVTNRAGSRWFEVAFRELYAGLKKRGLPHSEASLLGKDGILYFQYTSDPTSEKPSDPKYDWNTLLKFNLVNSNIQSAQNAVNRQSGSIIEEQKGTGISQIVGYSPILSEKFIEKLGWSVMVRDDQAEVMAVLQHATNLFYTIFTVITVIAGCAAYFLSMNLSNLTNTLSALATRLSKGSSDVLSAANTISQSSSELSEAATEQASAIQQTAASIDEVSSMVKKSADNASQSQKVSQTSRSAAEQGQQAVQEMIQSINDISQSNTAIMNQVEDGNRQISEIVKVISEIGNKTKVINDIVFQTKLLSFNASVEAARAGEHGKGFAVVAEEVGNLAQMSGNAAKEISSMLDSSIQKVEGIVNNTKTKVERLVVESKTKVETGTQVANHCAEALNNILSTVSEVDGMVREISSASQEQAQGVSEINKAMNQLDQVTQQNTAIAQSTASSAEQLSAQANQLRQMVHDLFMVISGTHEFRKNDTEVATTELSEQKTSKTTQVFAMSNARKGKNKPNTQSRSMKLVAGAEYSTYGNSLPSEDDPRFEDV